ncbi:MAG: gliding motility-associated lipoprotein GldD [Flavobacteriaceae bacterium]|jgi:gliding motility-associated lipoprotein GldD|uniref:gliding motility lipoprotein GldD n=1 Tax=Candidatus Marifrigoribacter sp. Uisw_064 TaxID=3230970 RepID=UPI003ADFC968
MRFLLVVFLALTVVACNDEVTIKPNSKLRLEYPTPEYESVEMEFPYTFKKNKEASLISKRNGGINLKYSKMKATIYLTYQKVNNKQSIDSLLYDAQKLTYDHTVKAESILEQPRVDSINNVYGMFYMINGNAATHSQFYVTDSVNHFVTGSLYFNIKPNYDSLYPAIVYLRNDVRTLMETIEWN